MSQAVVAIEVANAAAVMRRKCEMLVAAGMRCGGIPSSCSVSTATKKNAMAMPWTAAAEARLKEVPFFVRPAVRRRIEKLAAEAGLAEVDEAHYDKARAAFGQS